MSDLRNALEEYLAVRRALGFKLRLAGSLLHTFVRFAEQEGALYITTDLAVRWATQPKNCRPVQYGNRLSMVRGFARYLQAVDSRTETPPEGLFPTRYPRKEPYIYSDKEISRLIGAARQLQSSKGLRAATYSTLLGLLAVTGMRMCEPIALDRDDVDLTQGILNVRKTKFGKSRLVPVHSTTQKALQRYVRLREQLCPHPHTPSFFVSERGKRLTEWAVRWTFVKLSRQTKLRGQDDSHGPRLHDFRHGFAVGTLLAWYRAGIDIERHLPELSAYLGHAHVSDTYWYLTATPELLQAAARRLDTKKGPTQ
jgi:integrase